MGCDRVIESRNFIPFVVFEDAVVHGAASNAEVDGIVTRDIRGFKQATLPVYSQEKLIQILRGR